MTVGTVTPIRQDSGTVTIGTAIGAFLATIGRPESRGTHRQYAATLRRFRDRFGAGTGPGAPGDEETWGQRAPATYNRAIDVFRSAFGYWAAQDWRATDPTRPLRRRGSPRTGPGPCPKPASSRCWAGPR